MNTSDGQTANLFANLLTLQTAIQNSDHVSYQDIQQYLKRIEQSPLVQTDRDLQGVCYKLRHETIFRGQTQSSKILFWSIQANFSQRLNILSVNL
jgi:hypothetical protein